MNISLANGSEGYIPPPEQHALGGYTTWPARTAALVSMAEPAIVQCIHELLQKLAEGKIEAVPNFPREQNGNYPQTILASKPEWYWRLDDLRYLPIDTKGDLLAGSFEPGIALYVDGPSGEQFSGKQTNRAIHFAGGRMTTTPNDFGTSWSTEFWFWNGLPHDAGPVTACLFSCGDPQDEHAKGYHLGIGGTQRGTGRLIFSSGDDHQEILVGQTELKVKHWHHVVFVREGTRITVYLDGNPEPDISGSTKVNFIRGSQRMFYGGRSDKAALFEGKLDEISLYDRALPTEEVLKHAKAAGLEPPPAKQSRALSPEESQKTLYLPPGLRAELVASEPQIESPVAMAFDERNRLWVVEMLDYPNGPKPGEPGMSRVKLLTDNNGDGHYETAKVFADKLLFANGLIPYRDGVIVTAAPEILWLRDTDDDGVCDKREVLYKGFVAGNPQLRVSHPILLPDGRICVVNGLRGGKIVRGGDTPGEPIDISGRDFAFDPRRGTAEAITGMGQFGNTLDDAGNRFVCTNRNHWIHIGLDEKYLKRNPWMAVPPRAGDNQAPGGAARIFPLTHQVTTANEHQGTFTAACGVHVYRGLGLPLTYRGSIFTCEPTANLVHHEALVPHGSTFIGKPGLNGQELLASTDPWFRPVFLAGGPDGALYVVDMYRKVIEHPEWLPPSLRHSPDFGLGKDRGRIWRIVEDDPKHDFELKRYLKVQESLPFTPEDTGKFVKLLEHPDGWWRTMAQRMLLDSLNDKAVISDLRTSLTRTSDASAKLLIASLLVYQGELKETDMKHLVAINDILAKPYALRFVEKFTNSFEVLEGAHHVGSRNAHARYQFAATLGEWNDNRALSPLAYILESDADDPLTRLAVLSSVGTRSGMLAAGLLQQGSNFRANGMTPGKLQVLSELASVVAARQDAEELKLLLRATKAVAGPAATSIHLAIRRGLIEGAARRGEQLPAVLTRLPEGSEHLSDFVTKLTHGSLQLASAGPKVTPERLTAISECAQIEWPTAKTVLLELMKPDHDARVRVYAIRAAATFNKPEVAPAIVAAWDNDDEFLRAALQALLSQPERVLVLLTALESGTIKAVHLDNNRRQQLLSHRRRDIRERAAAIFAAVPTVERQAIVKEYQAALKLTGDAKRGQELFRGKATCAQCHRVGDVGHAVGPNLSELRTKTPAMLLNDILDPNGAIDANFVNYTVTLTNGKTVTGIIAAESANSLTLRRAEGQADTITRSDIEPDGLVNTRRSLMPEGIEKTLNPQELADVLAYLHQWSELP
jgi:putative membrane-bound dehydrogenase-like protein